MNRIPSDNVITASKRLLSQVTSNRKHIVEFINTENNKDNYFCELYLRKVKRKVKIKLILYTGILDYAAFEEIWVFRKDQNELALDVYYDILKELDNVQAQYNSTMVPSSNIMPMIRNKIKDIGPKFKRKTNVPSLDRSKSNVIAEDWRETIYGTKYPDQPKHGITNFSGDQEQAPLSRKTYQTRQSIN